MGVASREMPGGALPVATTSVARSWTAGSTHCGHCVHGSHLLSMDRDRRDVRTPATRCATGFRPVALSQSNAQPTLTPLRGATGLARTEQMRDLRGLAGEGLGLPLDVLIG